MNLFRHHESLRGTAASPSLVLLLLFLTAVLGAAQITQNSPPSQQPPPVAVSSTLPPGETTKRAVRGGERQTLSIALTAGQYAQFVFWWRGIDLDAAVFKPDGGRDGDFTVQIRAPGPTSISIIADVAGEYRIEVSPKDGLKVNGTYEVQVRAVRPPTATDKSRFMAERTLAEGKRAGWQAPEAKFKESLQHWREAADPEGEATTLSALAELYQNTGDFEKVRTTYEAAREIRRRLNDPAGEAHTLLNLGRAYQTLSSPQEALNYYGQALSLFRAAGDRTGESMALYSAGFALARAGRVREAVKSYEAALSIQSADADRLGEVRTLTALGGAYDRLGDYDRALALYQRAAPIRQELGDRLGAALTINNIGVLHDNWGDWQKARESYEATLAAYGALLDGGLTACVADTPSSASRICEYAASAYDNLGELYNSLGDPLAALSTFEKSLVIRDKLNRPKGQGSTRSRMCYSNLLLGRPRDALSLCQGAGDRKGALSFQEPPDTLKPSIDPPGLANTYLFMGMAYDALNEREKALEYFGRASEIQRKIDDPRALAITLDKAGAAYERTGDTKKAFESFDEALHLWQRINDLDGKAITLYKIARAERGRGNLVDAHARIMSALDIIESLRVKVTAQRLRASYFAQKLDYYELAVDLKMQLAQAGGRSVAAPGELVAAALQTSERARARVLFDILAEARVEPRGGMDQTLEELLRRRQKIQQRLDFKAALQTKLLAGKASSEELAFIEKELLQLAAEYDDVDAQARARSTRYAELTRPQLLSVAEIQSQLLDEQTLLLEYNLGEERSYLWVVAQSGIKSFELRKRAEIENAARRVRDILKAEQKQPGEPARAYETRLAGLESQYRKEAALLSDMLLGPAAAELGRKRLLIVAEGELQQIPFVALPAPEAATDDPARMRLLNAADLTAENTPPPLGEAHEIVGLPSASTLAALRVMTQKREHLSKAVAVIADPVFDREDPRLQDALKEQSVPAAPHQRPQALEDAVRSFGAGLQRLMASRREANDIVAAAPAQTASVALGFAANRTTATASELSQYRFVHFATHAVFNDRQPELSGIVLSLFDERGRPREDGFLRLHDIYNMNLPVDMVVLSACQTGLGKQVRGEGLIGLTRGFMYAGAARVVASLWKVDDEATAELMKFFYRHMLRDGMSPPAALRQAQMSLRRQRRWSAPYYWAGFVLQGEWK
ncbi:MAG TPA: CHAT domain-containing protein [Pyrinomonadaceae bacterium]|jgi:CHAT domain-containing protein